jgi:NAD(P)-dependent dehydrogenase (short-subunit alcohol dehydrogenase family)
MAGKTCVVTGATSGIGLETAAGLASQGALVVMVARSLTRGIDAIDKIVARGAHRSNVDLLLADLFVQDDIRKVAAKINDFYPRVDVLVNNAGLLIGKRSLTPDGIESTFALNHLGYFLLTNLLLDKIKASAPARIVNVSSEAHWAARWDWDNLQGERKWGQFRAYANSKLANLLFTYELARRLEGTGVTVNAVHPGLVRSGFGRTGSPALRVLVKLGSPMMISSKRGADSVLWAASAQEPAGATGKYYIRRRESNSSLLSRDRTAQRRLWEISERLTGLSGPP